MDYERLNAFITSYRRGCSCFSADWNLLYGAGYSWLDWLEYNIRRSLMIECENEEEQRLGISEVHETIRRIVYYHSIKDELLAHLSEIC